MIEQRLAAFVYGLYNAVRLFYYVMLHFQVKRINMVLKCHLLWVGAFRAVRLQLATHAALAATLAHLLHIPHNQG